MAVVLHITTDAEWRAAVVAGTRPLIKSPWIWTCYLRNALLATAAAISSRSGAVGQVAVLLLANADAGHTVPDRDQRFRDQRFRQQPYAYAFIMDRLGMKLRPVVKP
jgi:hypothetical protein